MLRCPYLAPMPNENRAPFASAGGLRAPEQSAPFAMRSFEV
jgi:hypothetical protein